MTHPRLFLKPRPRLMRDFVRERLLGFELRQQAREERRAKAQERDRRAMEPLQDRLFYS